MNCKDCGKNPVLSAFIGRCRPCQMIYAQSERKKNLELRERTPKGTGDSTPRRHADANRHREARYKGCQVCDDWAWYSDTRMTCWSCQKNGYCTAPHCKEQFCKKHREFPCVVLGCTARGVHEREFGWRCVQHEHTLTSRDPIGSAVDVLKIVIGVPLALVLWLFKSRDPLTGMTEEEIANERWEAERKKRNNDWGPPSDY